MVLPLTFVDGKMREQVDIERKVRRNYPLKWGPLGDIKLYHFYKPNKINAELNNAKKVPSKVFEYTNEGDSFFVSQQMYESLIEKCRCGRPKFGTHLMKCLQKIKYDDKDEDNDDSKKTNIHLDSPLPKTSSGMIGWPNSKYKKMDRLTFAKNIAENIVGYRVTDHPYNTLLIA